MGIVFLKFWEILIDLYVKATKSEQFEFKN